MSSAGTRRIVRPPRGGWRGKWDAWVLSTRQGVATRLGRLAESVGGATFGGRGQDEPELAGYRRLSDARTQRDLQIQDHERSVQTAHYLYGSNCKAKFLIDVQVVMALGKTVGYGIAIDPKLAGLSETAARSAETYARKILDKFWRHPTHDIGGRAREYFTTYKCSGSLVLPLSALNKVDGTPQLDMIDSQEITGIVPIEGSSMTPSIVRLTDRGGSEQPRRRMRILRPDELGDYARLSEDELFLIANQDGPIVERVGFYFRQANILNALKGRPETLDTGDWVDAGDQYLFGELDKQLLLTKMVWDLEVTGMQQKDIAEQVALFVSAQTGPGGVFGHNEKVKVNPMRPAVDSSATSEMARAIDVNWLGSRCIPESWYSSGADTNRAVGAEQSNITFRALMGVQDDARQIFEEMLFFAYDQAAQRQPARLPLRSTGAVKLTVTLPMIAERDAAVLANTLPALQSSLSAAVDDEFVSRATARRVFIGALAKLSGDEIKLDVELALIKGEKDERDAKAADKAEQEQAQTQARFDRAQVQAQADETAAAA